MPEILLNYLFTVYTHTHPSQHLSVVYRGLERFNEVVYSRQSYSEETVVLYGFLLGQLRRQNDDGILSPPASTVNCGFNYTTLSITDSHDDVRLMTGVMSKKVMK
jgi:hypothetical protein